MTFNPDIPNAGQSPSQFPAQSIANFTRLQTMLGADHQFNLSATGNDGYHKVAHFVTQGSNPANVAGIGQLFTKTSNSDQHLFYETGTGVVQQLTGPTSAAVDGYTTIPGGLILQWGKVSSTSSGTVTFPIAFPTACLQVQTTAFYNGASPNGAAGVGVRSNFTTTQFVWVFNSNSGSYNGFYWVAIGY